MSSMAIDVKHGKCKEDRLNEKKSSFLDVAQSRLDDEKRSTVSQGSPMLRKNDSTEKRSTLMRSKEVDIE